MFGCGDFWDFFWPRNPPSTKHPGPHKVHHLLPHQQSILGFWKRCFCQRKDSVAGLLARPAVTGAGSCLRALPFHLDPCPFAVRLSRRANSQTLRGPRTTLKASKPTRRAIFQGDNNPAICRVLLSEHFFPVQSYSSPWRSLTGSPRATKPA